MRTLTLTLLALALIGAVQPSAVMAQEVSESPEARSSDVLRANRQKDLKERVESSKTRVTERQEKRAQWRRDAIKETRCSEVGAKVDGQLRAAAEVAQNQQSRIDAFTAKATDFKAQAEAAGYDVAGVTAAIATFSAAVARQEAAYDTYVAKISELSEESCMASADTFRTTLAEAKAARAQVKTAGEAVRAAAQGVRDAFKALREVSSN